MTLSLRVLTAFSTLACGLLLAAPALGDPPRVLPAGKLPADVRLNPPKDLDGYFPFQVPKSKEEWATRADRVRRRILVSQGLWPMPAKTPLNPIIHGRLDQGDYTVEKVYFESFPGFFVTGSLYRPKKIVGKIPGVLHPHGHWANGRFYDVGRDGVRKEIAEGAERFENGGRSPLQARCVQLARMGCTSFHYDMIGYADSQQLSFELVHRFGKPRPEMDSPDNWGLFSTPAESRLQSVCGLQTWNSIRALDFLLSLPEVDAARIGVTGASGGGTQTMLLAAVDLRITAAFPAVMVSTSMQGGCTCENSCCLRVDTGNIEFAALFAPKPQGMNSANDWTKEMATKGFPELKALYTLLGAPDNVQLKQGVHFGHNYNHVTRTAMYGLFNKHFQLGGEEPVLEADYPRLETSQLSVWDAQHPAPPGGPDFERKLLRHWADDVNRQIAELIPKDDASFKKFREVLGGGIDAILGRAAPQAADVEWEKIDELAQGDLIRFTGLLRNKPRGEELPALFFLPKKWNKQVVIWINEEGKAGLLTADGAPRPDVQKLLSAGAAVCGVDLLFQGEFLPDGKPISHTRKVANPREFAGYTFGYNHSLFEQRVHDVLTVIGFCKHYKLKPDVIDLIALDGTGPIAAMALAQAGGIVRKAALDTHGFRFGKLTDFHDPMFMPGAAKYGDLPGILSLVAPVELQLAGETPDSAPLVAAAYRALGAEKNVSWQPAGAKPGAESAVSFVLGMSK